MPEGFEEVDVPHGLELAAYVDAERQVRIQTAFGPVDSVPVPAGWEDRWRELHRPVEVAGLWIGPPWAMPRRGVPGVVVEPARAFGTGAHPTTRLCIEQLARLRRGALLDVGCGSGVLSLAAARLGFRPIVAVDVDPVAVDATRANARANGVELDARVLDATVEELPPADVAVANILLADVERILARLRSRLAVASGYVVSDRPRTPGWRHRSRLELDGWAADVFERH